MAIYSIAARTSNTTNNTACFEIRANGAKRTRIMEIGITMAQATASAFGVGRPQSIGVNPTSPVTVGAEDPEDGNSLAVIAAAWGTAPTIPLKFFRRIALPATIGQGILWPFYPNGLVIPLNGSIVVWNLSVVGAMDAYVKIDE